MESDKENESDNESTEIIEEKPKRKMTDKQLETLAKGRVRRVEIARERNEKIKELKNTIVGKHKLKKNIPTPVIKEEIIIDSSSEEEEIIIKKKPIKKHKKKIIYQEASDSSSSEEEIIIKKKTIKKVIEQPKEIVKPVIQIQRIRFV